MGKKQYWNSEAKNKRWIKEGRGQGTGASYKPWLTVRDVASEGRSHRVFGHLSQRTHHLLSDLELATFLLLQWRPCTTDIREQFPLDRELTRQICVDVGIAHPSYQGVEQYMSSDFLVNTSENGKLQFAIQVKPQSALENARTIEKLEIERRYWLNKKVPWFLVSENQIPNTVFSNINVLYNHIDEGADVRAVLIQLELFERHLVESPSLKVIDLCISLDNTYDLEPGESLYQLKRLLAQRFFHFDIRRPFVDLRCSDLISESAVRVEGGWCVSSK